jgi:tetratricopeptide (TPR) repeat protein
VPDIRRRPRAAALLRLAALASIAVAARPSAAPAPAWWELSSEHFVLRTDLEREDAGKVIRELELVRTLLTKALSLELPASTPRIQAVAFARADDLFEFTGDRRIAGKAYSQPSGRGQLLVMDGRPADMRVVVAHELAHALLAQVIPRQPRWFAEGMAQWVSSIGRIDAEGTRWLGTLPDEWMAEELRPGRMVSVKELLAWDEVQDDGRRYAASWLLVRMLIDERPAAFADFEHRLVLGEAATQAWNHSFPEWSLEAPRGIEALDALLRVRARNLTDPSRQVHAEVDPRFEVRAMTAAELHTMRLTLPREWKPKDLHAELAAALHEDPAHVLALTFLAQERTSLRLALAQRAVEAHPEDPDAWALLADVQSPDAAAAREEALRKAVGLAPDRADLGVTLAEALLGPRPEEAEEIARHAIELAPWAYEPRETLARALVALGRCEEATAEEQRSLDLAHLELGGREQRENERFQRRLGRLCRSPEALRAEALLRDADRVWELDRREDALALYDEALQIDPTHPDAWDGRGVLLLSLDLPREAEASFRKQLAILPGHFFAWTHLGRALVAQGRREDALPAFRKALALAPEYAPAARSLAETLVALGRAREAVSLLERSAKDRPENPYLLVDLGRARIAAGDRARGFADLAKAVATKREALVLNNASFSLVEFGTSELAQAEAWAEAAVEKHAENLRDAAGGPPGSDEIDEADLLASAWDTLGWVRFRQGRLAEAERRVAGSLTIDESAEGWRHLGQILEKRGKRARAIAAYAAALTFDPDRPARTRLEALVGPARISGLVAQARAEILRRRVLAVRPAPDANAVDERIVLVLGPDGRVADVLPGTGKPVPGADALRGAQHPIPFLDRGVPRLVLAARYRCAAGSCAWLLGNKPAPAGPLPRPALEAPSKGAGE